jgi:hypothetical protein
LLLQLLIALLLLRLLLFHLFLTPLRHPVRPVHGDIFPRRQNGRGLGGGFPVPFMTPIGVTMVPMWLWTRLRRRRFGRTGMPRLGRSRGWQDRSRRGTRPLEDILNGQGGDHDRLVGTLVVLFVRRFISPALHSAADL